MSGLADQLSQSPALGCHSVAAADGDSYDASAARANPGASSGDDTKNKSPDAKRPDDEPAGSAANSRPQSSLSTSTSSGSAQSNKTTASTGTHTMGKFKDKRPEPLKLNPNLNQEIPLDLSVRR